MMKNTILTITAILLLSTADLASAASIDTENPRSTPPNMTEQKLNPGQPQNTLEPERRGCCSWHGGVCGCEDGRALCCDGTLSPTCGCD
ncbi:MAG: hypothetical protein ACOY4W_03765 [Thermodesulfobacteriota bacterium]